MTDQEHSADADDATNVAPGRGSPPRMPRWVKWPAVILGVLILVFLVLRLTGLGGMHGPGRHLPGGEVPPGSGTPGGHTPMGSHG